MLCEECRPLVEHFFEGALARTEAAGVSAHLASCAACSEALESLREEQEMYAGFWREAAVSTPSWDAVLSGIEAERRAANSRPAPARAPKRAALPFAFGLRPAAATLALCAVLVGLVGLVGLGLWASRRGAGPAGGLAAHEPAASEVEVAGAGAASTPDAPFSSSVNGQVSAGDKTGLPAEVGSGSEPRAQPEAQAGGAALRPHLTREAATSPRASLKGSNVAAARANLEAGAGATASAARDEAAADAARFERAMLLSRAAASPPLKPPAGPAQMGEEVSQHFGGMELLFRSLKNAGVGGQAVDVGYEKGLSRRLLNRNVLLRREAGSRGDLPLEELLDAVEPVFAEIANLPEQASPAEVSLIKERIRKKGVLALLKAYSAAPATEATRESF